jgi:hypothetical protein
MTSNDPQNPRLVDNRETQNVAASASFDQAAGVQLLAGMGRRRLFFFLHGIVVQTDTTHSPP